ncbi:MAG: ATP-binding protein [Romboutsia sp.]|uniref:sensor histidine kinase n=1 Tax=Romboutsia sp. TaxID=1965302 RepID=UPI003F332200
MKSILNKLRGYVIVFDRNRRIKYCNDNLIEKSGYKLEEIINNDITTIMEMDDLIYNYLEENLDIKNYYYIIGKNKQRIKTQGSVVLDKFEGEDAYFLISDDYNSISKIEDLERKLEIEYEKRADIEKKLELYFEEQKKFEEEKIKLEEAVKIESVKNEFFANISHEFKTPLNIILGTMQLIRKNIEQDNITYDTLYKHTNIIKQNSYRLLRLVNNLIDISRIDTGYYKLNQSNQNIVKIVEDITLSVAEYVENRNIDLIFDTNEEEVITACDPDKIERVILNILSNAIKYTPKGGKIEVKLERNLDKVLVYIKDNGIGIPKEKADVIFDRFGQVNSELSRNSEGSGIGLSLVKSILSLHGGDINVYSKVGEGSEFVFELPIVLLEEEIVYTIQDSRDFTIEKCNIEFSDIYSININ